MKSPEEQYKNKVLLYQRVFGSKDGKKVLEDLAQICFAHESTFIPGQPEATSVNEGCRRVWLHIERLLKENPDKVRPTTQTSQEE